MNWKQSCLQVMVQRVEGLAAARESASAGKVSELESSLVMARQEVSKLRTSAGTEESRALALERQLDETHRKALAEVESERSRLQVSPPPALNDLYELLAPLACGSLRNWCSACISSHVSLIGSACALSLDRIR
jgi:hypothetical protein